MGSVNRGTAIAPPIDDRSPIRKFSIDCLDASKTKEQTQPQVTRYCKESRRKADTEFQYRPRIVDTEIDCGPRFCGPRFRDCYLKNAAISADFAAKLATKLEMLDFVICKRSFLFRDCGFWGAQVVILRPPFSRAAKRGGFKRGGFPIWTCPSFFVLKSFVLFGTFSIFLGFSRFAWGRSGDFPRFVLFLFLGVLRAPTRNSPERVRDTIWTFSEKSGKYPGLEPPRLSFSKNLKM